MVHEGLRVKGNLGDSEEAREQDGQKSAPQGEGKVAWAGRDSGPGFGDFGDFGVSFVATVAGRYTRRGGPRLSVQGEPLIVLTREP